MKLALAALLGSSLLTPGLVPAAHGAPLTAAVTAPSPQLRHADALELLERLRADLRTLRELIHGMGRLAVLATNGQLSAEERMLLDLRFQHLVGRLDQIASTSSSSRVALLDGSCTSVALQVDPTQTQTWSQTLTDCTSTTLGLSRLHVTTQVGAAQALSPCETAACVVEDALEDVRAGWAVLGGG